MEVVDKFFRMDFLNESKWGKKSNLFTRSRKWYEYKMHRQASSTVSSVENVSQPSSFAERDLHTPTLDAAECRDILNNMSPGELN